MRLRVPRAARHPAADRTGPVRLQLRLQDRRPRRTRVAGSMSFARRVLPLTVLAVLLGGSMPAQGQESLRDAQKRLRASVAAEEAKIADTREGIADANRRLG